MMRYLLLQVASNTWEQKYRVPDTYYMNNDYKLYEDVINFIN